MSDSSSWNPFRGKAFTNAIFSIPAILSVRLCVHLLSVCVCLSLRLTSRVSNIGLHSRAEIDIGQLAQPHKQQLLIDALHIMSNHDVSLVRRVVLPIGASRLAGSLQL